MKGLLPRAFYQGPFTKGQVFVQNKETNDHTCLVSASISRCTNLCSSLSSLLKREAEIRKRQEEEQRRRKAEIESKQLDVNAKFESLEEEVQVKSKQLKKLFEKYQAK